MRFQAKKCKKAWFRDNFVHFKISKLILKLVNFVKLVKRIEILVKLLHSKKTNTHHQSKHNLLIASLVKETLAAGKENLNAKKITGVCR